MTYRRNRGIRSANDIKYRVDMLSVPIVKLSPTTVIPNDVISWIADNAEMGIDQGYLIDISVLESVMDGEDSFRSQLFEILVGIAKKQASDYIIFSPY